MEKWLCWGAMGIAALMLLLFLADLFAQTPFGGLNKFVDVVAVLACVIIFYLGWDAWQDLR